jgi:hypothetical protein
MIAMAHFYGEMQGNRKRVSRCGDKVSGMWCHVRGWHIGVEVELTYDIETNQDVIKISQTTGSSRPLRKEVIAIIREP